MRQVIVRIIAVAVLGLGAGLLVGATLPALAPLPAGRILIRSPIVLHPQRETVTAKETVLPAGATAVADPVSPTATSGRVTTRPATSVPASPRPRTAGVPAPLPPAPAPARALVNPFEISAPVPASIPAMLPAGSGPAVVPVPTPAAPTDPIVRTQGTLEANRAEADEPQRPTVTVAVGASGAAVESRTAQTTVERNESR